MCSSSSRPVATIRHYIVGFVIYAFLFAFVCAIAICSQHFFGQTIATATMMYNETTASQWWKISYSDGTTADCYSCSQDNGGSWSCNRCYTSESSFIGCR